MAAGLGFKDFTTGEVLTAADVDGYLMQGIWVFASAAARDAAVTSPQEGNFAYLKDTNVTTYYTGSAWTNLDTTGMTNPMTTTGDIIYSSPGSTPVRLGIGSTGDVLTVASGVPSWAAPAGGATFVGCQVYKSAAQTLTNNTETALTFDTERFDTDAFHNNSTNTSRMTIPSGKAGYYLVIATVAFGSNSTPARAVTLRLNGSEHAYLQQIQPVSNGGSITGGSYILNCAVADYLEIYVRQESGGNLDVGSGSAGTSFTIQYLGA